jgi:serine/threonine protein kinase
MFIDEAKICGQLNHANICQIFELGRIDDSHFIAMEYIWGKDVLQIQNRFRRAAQVYAGQYGGVFREQDVRRARLCPS